MHSLINVGKVSFKVLMGHWVLVMFSSHCQDCEVRAGWGVAADVSAHFCGVISSAMANFNQRRDIISLFSWEDTYTI